MATDPPSGPGPGTTAPTGFTVTRAGLKACCEQGRWDQLDQMLARDATLIDDDALFTDGWGLWWGMLFEAAAQGAVDGVRVLLRHGAQRDRGCWGDGEAMSPAQAAQDHPAVLALLQAPPAVEPPRAADPAWPPGEPAQAQALQRQAELRQRTGLVFDAGALQPDRQEDDRAPR